MPIIKACPRLKKLSLHDTRLLTATTLACLSSLSNLKELELHKSIISSEHIITFIKSSPHLEVLQLGNIEDNSVLLSLGLYCPRLRLIISYNHSMTSTMSDAGVIAMARGCPLLEEIRLVSCQGYDLSDLALAAIAECCHHLQRIWLGYSSRRVTDVGLIALSRRCPHMKELHINNNTITDATVLSFAEHCHELESVHITCSDNKFITSSAVCSLFQASPGVTSIELGSYCNPARGDHNANAYLADEVLLAISQHCTKLTRLTLKNRTMLTEAPLYAVITKCIHLRYIRIFNYNISDAFIRSLLHHCPQLTSISLDRCSHITYRSLFNMLDMGKRLRFINMSACNRLTRGCLSKLLCLLLVIVVLRMLIYERLSCIVRTVDFGFLWSSCVLSMYTCVRYMCIYRKLSMTHVHVYRSLRIPWSLLHHSAWLTMVMIDSAYAYRVLYWRMLIYLVLLYAVECVNMYGIYI